MVVGAAGNRLDVPTSPSYGASSGTSQTNEEYVSKFNYDATRDDELTLTKGMAYKNVTTRWNFFFAHDQST